MEDGVSGGLPRMSRSLPHLKWEKQERTCQAEEADKHTVLQRNWAGPAANFIMQTLQNRFRHLDLIWLETGATEGLEAKQQYQVCVLERSLWLYRVEGIRWRQNWKQGGQLALGKSSKQDMMIAGKPGETEVDQFERYLGSSIGTSWWWTGCERWRWRIKDASKLFGLGS